MPARPINDVMIILERRFGETTEICLAERRNTGYADGRLNLPSGKVEEGEDIFDAVIRETHEEVGLRLHRDALRLVHVMYFRNPEGETRIGWFFAVSEYRGEPVNQEPAKCAGLSWHRPDDLPDNTVRYNALGIGHAFKGEPTSAHWHDWDEVGWS
ncbi:NUDIX domain-containing protein [Streptomyces sp. NPDC002889]|uniref:NUDIX domain-containing protein n=1 Tax=Streptomyces sp. NPDC002889 TaxID=3364669 RepID=UPI003681231B